MMPKIFASRNDDDRNVIADNIYTQQPLNPRRSTISQTVDPFNLTQARRYLIITPCLAITIWVFYLWGISKIGWKKATYSSTSPLSPNISNFFYYQVGDWPNCSNLRSQWWRLFSYQVVHSGLFHISKSYYIQDYMRY